MSGSSSADRKVRVTVGMVVKDCEETIEETVQSVYAQTYPHDLMKIVVVDGGSRDRTLPILTKAASAQRSRIPIGVYSDDGKGLGWARQVAVNNAEGEYLLWIDSDATMPENYLASLVEFIESHPRYGGVRGTQEARDQSGLIPSLEKLSLLSRRTPRNVFDTDGQIFRVDAVRQVGGFDVRIRGAAEDVDLVKRMINAHWSFSVIQVKFYHPVGSWMEIYHKRQRAGYGIHYLSHKYNMVKMLLNQVFPITLIVGIREAKSAYVLTRKKMAFLLPFWYCVRSIPWWMGFAKGHIDGYGHARSK